MTVNQNGLKISPRGDVWEQVRHISLPYFNDFNCMISTNSGLIPANAYLSELEKIQNCNY